MLQLVRLQCKYFKIVYIINCDLGPILGPEQEFEGNMFKNIFLKNYNL